jgi:hypothetical protein
LALKDSKIAKRGFGVLRAISVDRWSLRPPVAQTGLAVNERHLDGAGIPPANFMPNAQRKDCPWVLAGED